MIVIEHACAHAYVSSPLPCLQSLAASAVYAREVGGVSQVLCASLRLGLCDSKTASIPTHTYRRCASIGHIGVVAPCGIFPLASLEVYSPFIGIRYCMPWCFFRMLSVGELQCTLDSGV